MNYKRFSAVIVFVVAFLIFAGKPVSAQTSCVPLIDSQLSQGMRNQDVLDLQNFLVGQGLLGQESTSGYFGPLTLAALQKFQSTNNIVSSGSPSSTGYGVVGPKTRSLINSMECGGAPTTATTPLNPTGSLGNVRVSILANGSANPSSVASGSSVNLSWNATPSTLNCNAFASPSDESQWGNGSVGFVPLSGTQVMRPKVKTTYVIACVDSASSGSGYAMVTVNVTGDSNVPPSNNPVPPAGTPVSEDGKAYIDLRADGSDGSTPVNVPYGWATVLTWNVNPVTTLVSSCNGTGSGAGVKGVDATNWNSPKGRSGSLSMWPMNITTYKIVCNLVSGSSIDDSITVTVGSINNPPPSSGGVTVDLKANNSDSDQTLVSGGSVALTWSATPVTSATMVCVGSGSGTGATGIDASLWNGGKTYIGFMTARPLETTTYTITCTDTINGVFRTATDRVTVYATGGPTPGSPSSGGPTVDLNVNGNQGPITISPGSTVLLDWVATATTNVAIPCTTASVPASTWSIARPLIGIDVPVYPTAPTTTYSITCTDSQGRTSTDSIIVNISTSNNPYTGKFRISTNSGPGDVVKVTDQNVNVRSIASITGAVLGTHNTGDKGVVEHGPVVNSGYTWWYINFYVGVDGWVAEDFLVLSGLDTGDVTTTGPASKIYSLTASPSSVTSGQTSTITWSADAHYCGLYDDVNDIQGGLGGSQLGSFNPATAINGMFPSTKGSVSVSPASTWTYTLRCYKDFGTSGGSPTPGLQAPVIGTVTVNVVDGPAPTISSFTASPVSSASPIKDINLSWSADATSCRVEQFTDQLGGNIQTPGVSQVIWSGSGSGSKLVSPKSSGLFVLICKKNRQTVAKSLPVTVNYTNGDPSTLSVSSVMSNPSNSPVSVDAKINNSDGVNGVVSVKKGNTINYSWSSGNARMCFSSEPLLSGLVTSGSVSLPLTSIYTRESFDDPQVARSDRPVPVVVSCYGINGPYIEGQYNYVSATDVVTVKVTQ